MKKLISISLALISALSLAACGNGSGGAVPAPAVQSEVNTSETPKAADSATEKTPAKKTTLTYWYSWTDKIQENNINLVKQFNETVGKEKNIEVVAEYQGSYSELHQKLQAAYISGTTPAVTVMEIASIKTFAENGILEPLSPYIQRDSVDMTDFFEGLLGNCKVNDTWYGLPYLRSTPILYMNTTLLEKAGLDKNGPKTWTEFAEYAKAIKEKTGAYGFTLTSDPWFLEGFLMEYGTSVLSKDETKTNINTPEGKAVFKYFQNLKNQEVIRCVAGADASKVDADFMNQDTAMRVSSTANLSKILAIAKENNFEVNTCFFPAEVQHGVPTGGCNLIMTSKLSDDEKEGAWEFIKWMTSTEQTAYASAFTGYVPSRKSALETDKIKDLHKSTPQFKVALDQLEKYSTGRPMNPKYAEAQTELVNSMDAIWVNNGDVDSVLSAAEQKMNKVLGE